MQIKYFGEIEELTGKKEEEISLANNTITDLMDLLDKTYNLKRENVVLAVNKTIVQSESQQELKETDEIAILSPFAGG